MSSLKRIRSSTPYLSAVVLAVAGHCLSARAADISAAGAMTGAWFDPAFEGAGFLIEALPNDGAVVYWFTYDDQGDQQWFVGVGTTNGSELLIEDLQATRGARFGPDFDPDDVERISVGHAAFDFADCTSASVSFSVDGISGAQGLDRLTAIAGHECAPAGQTLASGNDLNQTGSWFNPDRSGEGVIVEVLDEQTAFVNWFTYDDQGEQAWFTGIGRMAGRFIHVADLLETSGGRFGAEHDPAAVVRTPRGQLELELGCDSGLMGYDTDMGAGRIELVRLTSIDGLACDEDRYHAPTASELIGTWSSDGFGMAAEITGSVFALYQFTAESCLPVLSGSADDLQEAVVGAELSINQDGDRVRFLGLDAVSPVFFDRRMLPASCNGGGTDFTADVRQNFEVFAATFGELYATFPLRGVDWNRQIEAFGGRISSQSSETELFSTMRAMVAPLHDGHVSLISSFSSFTAGATPERQALFNRANRQGVDQIIEGYLAGTARFAANGVIRYGTLDGATGYVGISRFFDIYPGIETGLALARFADDVDAVVRYFNQRGADSLIIDVRRNQGGDSKFGYELAGRFYGDRSRLVFSERRPTGAGLSASIPTSIKPSARARFDGPAAVLISPMTASAAEIFTLAMRASPGTIIVGEPSVGVLSKTVRVLPNGWTVSVTPGIVYAPDGSAFEASGIPVDVVAPTFSEADLSAGIDGGIEAALAALSPDS